MQVADICYPYSFIQLIQSNLVHGLPNVDPFARLAIYMEIRNAIKASDKSRYRLCQETGLSQGHLCEFVGETKGLSPDNLEKLAAHLGLEIVVKPIKRNIRKNTRKKPRKKGR